MRVWRVQNKNGYGPYTSAITSNWADEGRGHDLISGRPNATEERLSWNEDPSWKFGFLNLQQLESWFSQTELQKLADIGFEVVQIWAKDVIVGDYQVIFLEERVPMVLPEAA